MSQSFDINTQEGDRIVVSLMSNNKAIDNDAYREAMDDIANNRVYSASSAEEMMEQILE